MLLLLSFQVYLAKDIHTNREHASECQFDKLMTNIKFRVPLQPLLRL